MKKRTKIIVLTEILLLLGMAVLFFIPFEKGEVNLKQKASGTDVEKPEVSGDMPDTESTPPAVTQSEADKDPDSEKEPEPEPDLPEFDITFSFVGDCVLATQHGQDYSWSFRQTALEQPNEYFFGKVSNIFLEDDFTMANCENVFSDRDLSPVSKENPPNYWFKSPSDHAGIFKAGGVDVVTISNNHSVDYGQEGYEDTKKALDDTDILWCDDENIAYAEKEGFRIAFIGVSMWNENYVDPIIKLLEKAKEKSDFQIVYFHGGKEGSYQVEDWKREACQNLIDNGADLIIGAHPHRLQMTETYKGVSIVYSLGNFVFGGNKGPERATAIFQETITVSGTEVKNRESDIIPCYVYTGEVNNWQPSIVEDESDKHAILSFMKGERESLF